MSKDKAIKSVLIIGAGPIVIGQACEFDYSGVQACKALKEEGIRVILVNSNPATIMTDPDMADKVYIEPIHWRNIEKIIINEKPDAILPTMGGQTALNTTLDLNRHKILQKYKVKIIGASIESIDMAEDRELFKNAMIDIGLETPIAYIAHNYNEALQHQKKIGFPILIRPSFTLGGSGGGIAYNIQDFETIVRRGLELSPTSEVLIEESVIGWKEFEMEVVRDKSDNCIIICSIENIDPMGVHTGDSITVAPAQTLTDKEYQKLRNASIQVLRKIGVDTGGSNVQFAISPHDGRILVIEMNPRVSRSSALASKATGFPIAKIAAKLAIGYTLDELSNEITGNIIPASFEPSIDYVVTKIPRFAFEKFKEADDKLTTQMKSVGEVMAIGRNFQESFQKALRGLEIGIDGLKEMQVSDNENHDFIKKHAKGETKHLFRPIDPLPKFVPNIDRLHPLRNPLGDQVAQLEPGESFGQLALLNKRRRAATVISEEVELLVLDKPDYDRIIRPIHEGKNKYDYMLHFMRQMHCFKTLAPKQLMSLAVSVSIHKLNPREALFEQNEKVRYLYIVISGSLLLSNRKKSGKEKNHMVSERHEIEICPALTMVAVRHTFDVKTIPRFEYRCSAGEEGGVILTLPMALVREVYNPTAMLLSKGLEASFKFLKNYAENRTKWHEVRLEFCKNYADL